MYDAKKLQHPFSEIEKEWENAAKENRSMSSKYYFDIYRLRFHPTPKDGYRYLERIMDNCKPSLGYHPLALMLTESNRNNLVITTNFDSLVEDSLFWYTNKKPLVVSHEALANFIDPDVQRPIIAKVHRGLMHDPFNSPDTTDHLEKEWKQPLDHAFRTYTPIIIGYAGGDQSLMQALEGATFQNGIYWCYRKASGLPDQRIQDFVEKQEGCLVEIDGFDALMLEMGSELFGKRISPSETQAYIQNQSNHQMKEYTEQWEKLNSQENLERVLQPINETESESRKKREKENRSTERDLIKQGNRCFPQKEYRKAIDFYNEALRLNPNNAITYANRALAHQYLKEYREALENIDIAISLDPMFSGAYRNRGNCYSDLNQHERAIRDYDKAIELDPNDTKAYNNRGNRYKDLGDDKRAIQDFDKAIELDPNYAVAYNNRGISYKNLDDDKRAIQDFDKAIELDPNYAVAYNNRGNVYWKMGDFKQAFQEYTKAIELDPEYILAYRNRAISYRAIGEIEKAEADEAKADELESSKKKDSP